MYDYHVWANGVIIDRLIELPKDIYQKDIQSGFTSISRVLSHMYLTDYTWFEIISGSRDMNEAMAFTNKLKEQIEPSSIEEMKKNFLNLAKKYKTLLNNQDDIEKVIVVDNPYAGLLETSISETLLHIVTHGSYHRGNIATMLRQMGHTSVMQDYGLYLYSNKTS
jgi:uncharacterized damage-inducible protein DinB